MGLYVYQMVFVGPNNLYTLGEVIQTLTQRKGISWLLGALFLMLGNWLLESVKWFYLARKAVSLSLPEAIRSTLIGLSLGVTVPAQLGDTLGRVSALSATDRLHALGAAVVSNGLQFYVSLLAATCAWWPISRLIGLPGLLRIMMLIVLVGCIGAGAFFFSQRQKLHLPPLFASFTPYFSVIKGYSSSELGIAFLVALARYGFFCAQYFFIFNLFDIPIDLFHTLLGIVFVLSVKTFVPALTVISDLGVREVSSLFFFSKLGVDTSAILVASLLIWSFNVLVPLLTGAILFWQKKWVSA